MLNIFYGFQFVSFFPPFPFPFPVFVFFVHHVLQLAVKSFIFLWFTLALAYSSDEECVKF